MALTTTALKKQEYQKILFGMNPEISHYLFFFFFFFFRRPRHKTVCIIYSCIVMCSNYSLLEPIFEEAGAPVPGVEYSVTTE